MQYMHGFPLSTSIAWDNLSVVFAEFPAISREEYCIYSGE